MKFRIRLSFIIQSFIFLFIFVENLFSFFTESKFWSLLFILTIPPAFVILLCDEIAYFNKKIVLTIMAVILTLIIGLISYSGVDLMQNYQIAGLSTVFLIGIVLLVFKDWNKIEKAVKQYDDILEMDPYDTTSLNNKGVELANLKKYKWAMEHFDNALEVDPNDSAVLHNKGVVLNELKKNRGGSRKAKEFFDQALAVDPGLNNAKRSGKLILEV